MSSIEILVAAVVFVVFVVFVVIPFVVRSAQWVSEKGRGANDWLLKKALKSAGVLFAVVGIAAAVGLSSMLERTKDLSNVSFQGDVTPTFNPSAKEITVEVKSVVNRGNGTSGNLILSLLACDAPYAGGDSKCFKLSEVGLADSLEPNSRFNSITRKFPLNGFPPFDEPQTIVVALKEKHSTDDGYRVIDYRNIEAAYFFKRDEWLTWWEWMSGWNWVGALLFFGVARSLFRKRTEADSTGNDQRPRLLPKPKNDT